METEDLAPLSSPEPEKKKKKTIQLTIRSAIQSDISPSKSLPEIALETLSIPEWKKQTMLLIGLSN